MKVLMINGSPRQFGNTYTALAEISGRLAVHGIDSDIVWIGTEAMHGCIACYQCMKTGVCRFNDSVYSEIREKIREADALIAGSPTYYGGPNGSLCALLDRFFLSCKKDIADKVWASVTVCRRGGASAAFQRLNMYAEMSNMVQATSQYWNIAYGKNKGEAAKDIEGMQTMRTLADNVAWLIKCTRSDLSQVPVRETVTQYNYVRED